jgi:hypothetical protein
LNGASVDLFSGSSLQYGNISFERETDTGGYSGAERYFCVYSQHVEPATQILSKQTNKTQNVLLIFVIEAVSAFAWEPQGDKFAIIHGESPKISASFYSCHKGGNTTLLSKFTSA